MKIDVADLGAHGLVWVIELTFRSFDCEVKGFSDFRLLEQRLSEFTDGDVLIGYLSEMEPGGIWDCDTAVEFITRLEDELLPKGAYALLLDTYMLYQSSLLTQAIDCCLGRIVLMPSPAHHDDILRVVSNWRDGKPQRMWHSATLLRRSICKP